MYQRIGAKAFKKDLSNTIALMHHLGEPHQGFPSVHVAGTNGKGSTSHIIAAVLQSHGLKVGLYTSPHYRDFRERIKVNGKYIPKKAVVQFVADNKQAFDSIRPSFFEITVALAFQWFAISRVDVAVIETGLGGRLDSTNVIIPELSVITNIGWDHMNFLGNTLELIAGEKAGIIKPGIPVVIGEVLPETRPVFEMHCREKDSPGYMAQERYSATPLAQDASGTTYLVDGNGLFAGQHLQLNAFGNYQQMNLVTSLTALEVLSETSDIFRLEEGPLRHGLAQLTALTRFKGRWQILGQAPLIIADSAHNEPGLQRVMAQLLEMPFDRLHIVLGAVSDKDIGTMLSLFPKNARYYFCKPDIPRGLDAESLVQAAGAFGLIGRSYRSVRYALRAAKRAATPADLIYIGGSTFVVAEVV